MPWLTRLRRSLGVYAWLAACIWAVLVAVATAQLLLTGSFDTGNAVVTALRDWLPWVVLAPVVVWLSKQFPLERGRLQVGIPVHVFACAAVVVICSFLGRQPAPPARMSPGYRGYRSVGPPDSGRRGPMGRPPFGRGPWEDWQNFGWQLQRARLQVPIYWLIVTVVHALAFYRRSQERERKAAELSASLAQARLQTLHMQLQPHFLFNALNAVSALIHKDPDAADDMVAELSELLRMSLDSSEQFETPLHRELEVLECYLRIERRRFGDRLDARVTAEPGVQRAYVPNLLLQPLAENAMRHGTGAQTGGVRVEISARRTGDILELQVTDNGPGLKPEATQGIGLGNTRARLMELYGKAGVLRVENAAAGGCVATVQIPFHTEPLTIAAAARA